MIDKDALLQIGVNVQIKIVQNNVTKAINAYNAHEKDSLHVLISALLKLDAELEELRELLPKANFTSDDIPF